MARGSCTYKQRDLVAALKAARKSGAQVARVEVKPDGTIVVIIGEPSTPEAKKGNVRQWLKAKD
jgi:hypothetical protein